MNIRDSFLQYWDGNGLLSFEPGTWAPGEKGSDNGILFTSIYYTLLKKSGQLTEQDGVDYNNKISPCIDSDGILNRVPVPEQDGVESVDDNYGLMNGSIELGNLGMPRKILWACVKYKGSLDNVNPGAWQWSDFLIRQPELLCAIVNASFPSLKNPVHWLLRLLCLPLYVISAITIATSCMGADLDDTTTRILAWNLQNNLKKTSLMCKIASWFWIRRLESDYANEMKDVAGIYFSPNGLNQNPYSQWWIT